MKVTRILAVVLALISLSLPACSMQEEEHHEESQKVVATSPQSKDVTLTQQYVCQIHSKRHIKVRALEMGYLEEIPVKEGQPVKEADLLFKVRPILYQSKLDAENAEATLAGLQLKYAEKLCADKVVSQNEVKLREAELAKAQAKAQLAAAELDFAAVKAPFDGIIDRLQQQQGSLVQEGEILTTLSDNSVMWVYFNVPEKYYLQYMVSRKQREKEGKIELVLANGDTFPQPGKIGAIEADFNNENGNIKFRADFPNPNGLLRHGQTGTVKIHRPLKNALIIPQRATFELLDKRYVWVLDENDIAHQRLITVKNELEDVFVIETGLEETDRIVLEGVREVEEDAKVAYDFVPPEEALKHQKFHAE